MLSAKSKYVKVIKMKSVTFSRHVIQRLDLQQHIVIDIHTTNNQVRLQASVFFVRMWVGENVGGSEKSRLFDVDAN